MTYKRRIKPLWITLCGIMLLGILPGCATVDRPAPCPERPTVSQAMMAPPENLWLLTPDSSKPAPATPGD
jgi:hypothetical protein